jgi:hypothetical protein
VKQAAEIGRADTRHYAKRQFTWFRHQLPEFEWVKPEAAEGWVDARTCRWGNGPAGGSLRRNLEARWRAALVERRSSLKMMVSITGVGQARSKHHRGTTMYHYAGIDVSLESSTICVVDGTGKILRETKVASEPEALIAWFRSSGLALERIGLEAGPLSQWLYAALREAGFAVELLETRHVRDAFKSMPVKSDRNDAAGSRN